MTPKDGFFSRLSLWTIAAPEKVVFLTLSLLVTLEFLSALGSVHGLVAQDVVM